MIKLSVKYLICKVTIFADESDDRLVIMPSLPYTTVHKSHQRRYLSGYTKLIYTTFYYIEE